jgi:hypothetical protein
MPAGHAEARNMVFHKNEIANQHYRVNELIMRRTEVPNQQGAWENPRSRISESLPAAAVHGDSATKVSVREIAF